MPKRLPSKKRGALFSVFDESFSNYILSAAIAAVFWGGVASAQDSEIEQRSQESEAEALSYEVRVDGAPTDEAKDLIERSLLLFRLQDEGAPNLVLLRRRAEGDAETVGRILRSQGYYQATVSTSVSEPAADDDEATAVVIIDPGPAFVLREHDIRIATPPGSPAEGRNAADFGSPVGDTAVAADIVAAEGAIVADLRGNGRPYAEQAERQTLADRDAAEISVRTDIDAGPFAVIGPVRFEGLESVEEDYLETYLPWELGETFDDQKLLEFQRALTRTSLFNVVSVRPPETPPEQVDGVSTAPIIVRAEEADHRSVGLGARFSTDDGPSARASFEHRNLFGRNETLNAAIEGGQERQVFDLGFRKPQYLRPQQDAVAALQLRNEDDEAFEETAATITAGLERTLSERWRVGLGGLFEVSQITDEGVDDLAILGGIPAFAAFDSSDDQLNPTRGRRARFAVTPFGGEFEGSATTFLTLEATGSAYQKLTEDGRWVLAGRGRLGSIINDSVDRVPSPRRFFSGGGGSVRGFEEQAVGPLDDDGDPIGGRSVVEAGIELRAQPFDTLGFVLFAEAGAVSEDLTPNFEEGVQVAVGPGFRYFSPVGPLRLDFGFPIDRRPTDDILQFYISIGQAF